MLHIRDDANEGTAADTAAQQSQAAVLAADSAVEKDGAVTEWKHFPMNLNTTGFVVFSVSCAITAYIRSYIPTYAATSSYVASYMLPI